MRGHIRKRGKRSWGIVIDLGRDEHGKRRQRWHTARGTKNDAQRELTRLLNSIHAGDYVEPTKMSVGEYLERWLTDYARTNVSRKTCERYEEISRNHIAPALGSLPLAKLQPLHIQSFYTKLLETGRLDGRGGLSPRTVLHIHRVLREALQCAVKWQLLARNPADAVQPPRAVSPEMRALSEDESAQLLQAAEGHRLHSPILIALSTGVRRAELLALTWSNTDLPAATLAVTQAVEQTREGVFFKETKTAKGRRLIALPSLAVEALRRHRVEQGKQRLQLGSAYLDHDLVFASPNGEVWNPMNFTAAFKLLVRRSGVRPIRFHDVRHSHASQLLRQGVHPKIVSERLGHANVSITLDTYSHVLPGLQEDAAARIDAALRAALGASRSSG